MVSLKMRRRGNDLGMRGSRTGSLAIATSVAAVFLIAWTSAADARGGWHGAGQAGGGGQVHAAGGRHGNDSYMKAASAERDKLLNTKLKSICRGC